MKVLTSCISNFLFPGNRLVKFLNMELNAGDIVCLPGFETTQNISKCFYFDFSNTGDFSSREAICKLKTNWTGGLAEIRNHAEKDSIFARKGFL